MNEGVVTEKTLLDLTTSMKVKWRAFPNRIQKWKSGRLIPGGIEVVLRTYGRKQDPQEQDRPRPVFLGSSVGNEAARVIRCAVGIRLHLYEKMSIRVASHTRPNTKSKHCSQQTPAITMIGLNFTHLG